MSHNYYKLIIYLHTLKQFPYHIFYTPCKQNRNVFTRRDATEIECHICQCKQNGEVLKCEACLEIVVQNAEDGESSLTYS